MGRTIATLAAASLWAVLPASARAEPPSDAAPRLAALVPADDARRAVAVGVTGEVYEPDGEGGWVHRLPCSTAHPVLAAGRAGDTIVALGEGAVYRLAANGWSAIRLVRRGKAILGAGMRSLAAVGRQLFALDPLVNGEPTRLAVAPAGIVGIGAGERGIVVATDAGVYRVQGGRLVALRAVPRGVRVVSERWGLVEGGAVDLTTARRVAWPQGLAIGVAAGAPGDALVAIGATAAGLELVTVRRGKLARDPLGVAGTAVGVVVDRAGRAVVALSDGRIARRDHGGWTIAQVRVEAPPAHPGAAPAISGAAPAISGASASR